MHYRQITSHERYLDLHPAPVGIHPVADRHRARPPSELDHTGDPPQRDAGRRLLPPLHSGAPSRSPDGSDATATADPRPRTHSLTPRPSGATRG